MKLKSTPNRVVQKRVMKHGKKSVVVWFKFDDTGIADIDESKVSQHDLNRLKTLFTVLEDQYTCKHCSYSTNNKGELLAHYRNDHPKGAK